MKKIFLTIIGLLFFINSFSQTQKPDSLTDFNVRVNVKELKVGDSLPNWGVIPIGKREWISLNDMCKEEMLLIEFWYVHCKYCIESIPKLNDLHKKHNGKGLKIVYVNALFNEGEKEIIKFKKEHKILFDVYNFGNIYEQGVLPTFMMIDKKGIIKYKSDGYPRDLVGDIEKLIN